jgi:sugar O-acyltransferase (sialic acid O-acetyltransferase NeuD family)
MYLYGASGHGKVIKEILESRNKKADGFIDDNPNVNELAGLPVLHSADEADEVVISIGVNRIRKKVAEKLNCKIANATIHRTAIVSDTSVLREGTVVMGGAIINADAQIGKHCIINTGASIDHECLLGDYVHVSPHATLCGNVTVGEGAWIGAGAIVIQGVKIGRWSMIGAGTVVTKDIPDGWLAVGNKCRLIKKINQDLL